MKRADQILSEREVDADFAADRTIDLGEQRRRDVHERDPAQERRRGESGGVANDAAADGDDGAAAIGAGADQRLVDARDRLQVLVALAVGDENRVAGAERARDALAVKPPDHRARDDEALAAGAMRVEQRGRPIGDAVADPDRRRARPRVHVDANRVLDYVKAQGTRLKAQVTTQITNRKSQIIL